MIEPVMELVPVPNLPLAIELDIQSIRVDLLQRTVAHRAS
jgi:hypothetical protein